MEKAPKKYPSLKEVAPVTLLIMQTNLSSPRLHGKHFLGVDVQLDDVFRHGASGTRSRKVVGMEEAHDSLPPFLLEDGHKICVDGRVFGLLQVSHQGAGLVPH